MTHIVLLFYVLVLFSNRIGNVFLSPAGRHMSLKYGVKFIRPCFLAKKVNVREFFSG
jgi:hypothetical protein